jgi:hypothetical protein
MIVVSVVGCFQSVSKTDQRGINIRGDGMECSRITEPKNKHQDMARKGTMGLEGLQAKAAEGQRNGQ